MARLVLINKHKKMHDIGLRSEKYIEIILSSIVDTIGMVYVITSREKKIHTLSSSTFRISTLFLVLDLTILAIHNC